MTRNPGAILLLALAGLLGCDDGSGGQAIVVNPLTISGGVGASQGGGDDDGDGEHADDDGDDDGDDDRSGGDDGDGDDGDGEDDDDR